MSELTTSVPPTRRRVWFVVLSLVAAALYIGVGASMTVLHLLIFWGKPCDITPETCDWTLFYVAGQSLMWGPTVLLVVILIFSIRAHLRGRSVRRVWMFGALALVVLFSLVYATSGIAVGWPTLLG